MIFQKILNLDQNPHHQSVIDTKRSVARKNHQSADLIHGHILDLCLGLGQNVGAEVMITNGKDKVHHQKRKKIVSTMIDAMLITTVLVLYYLIEM